jgi:hypothetical protein
VHWPCNSLEVLCPEILKLKQIAEKLSCALGNNHGAGLGDSLKTPGEVRGFAGYAALLRPSRIS